MAGFLNIGTKLRAIFRNCQHGIPPLRTAILLGSFVAVLAVAAFTVLYEGNTAQYWTNDSTVSTQSWEARCEAARKERDKSLDKLRAKGYAVDVVPMGRLNMHGTVVATAATTGANGVVSDLTFQVVNDGVCGKFRIGLGGGTIIFDDDDQSVFLYRTRAFHTTKSEVTSRFIGTHDGDEWVEPGEVVEINVPHLETTLSPPLGTDHEFSLQLNTPGASGGVLFKGKTLASLDTQNILD